MILTRHVESGGTAAAGQWRRAALLPAPSDFKTNLSLSSSQNFRLLSFFMNISYNKNNLREGGEMVTWDDPYCVRCIWD